MFHKEKQVALTYLTCRWMAWGIPALFLMMLLGLQGMPVFILGMPCMVGLVWIVAIVKWQFGNPRARLLPGYLKPHLLFFAIILSILFIINPLLVSWAQGIPPSGPFAFALSLGGCSVVSFLLNRSIGMLPSILIFFSGFAPQTHSFWFDNTSSNTPLHCVLIFIGCGMIGYCLWFLTQLTEEMDEYQVMPMGNINLSRAERAEQRRNIGRAVKKNRWVFAFTDRWLDQSFCKINPTQRNTFLAEFGFAGTPDYFAAILACVGFVVYSIAMMQFEFFSTSNPLAELKHPPGMLLCFAVSGPTAMAGMVLLQHSPRIAQELLRPANRTDYFNNLFLSLAKRSLTIWAGLFIGLCLLAYATDTLPRENTSLLIFKFALLSLSSQLLAYGLCLRFALWKSMFGYLFAFYAVVILQMAPIWYWSSHLEISVLFPTILTLNLAVGFCAIAWARRKWNQAEFG